MIWRKVLLKPIISHLTIGEDQVVFDPFMGSWTTRIALFNLNRKFIGIGLDKNTFENARKNIASKIGV